MKNIIRNRLKIMITSPDEILTVNIGVGDCKSKAALWLVTEVMKFNLENYGKNGMDGLSHLKNVIRESRWNNKVCFMRNFKHFLNIC